MLLNPPIFLTARDSQELYTYTDRGVEKEGRKGDRHILIRPGERERERERGRERERERERGGPLQLHLSPFI